MAMVYHGWGRIGWRLGQIKMTCQLIDYHLPVTCTSGIVYLGACTNRVFRYIH